MRVAIVHRSASMADLLAGILRCEPEFSVAWRADTAEEAILRCDEDPPDVALVDTALDAPGAIEATRGMTGTSSVQVVLISHHRSSDTRVIFEAMGAGAIDVVESPAVSSVGTLEGAEALVRKLRAAASLAAGKPRSLDIGRARSTPGRDVARWPKLVLIGASTGGPSALVTVLGSLPASFDAPIVVVQHVDAQFSGDLADWLRQQVPLPVVLARRGQAPRPGTITLTGTNDDLVMTAARQFAFSRPVDGSFYHPSVDVFFASVAHHWPIPGVATLLTGIGRDGASGMLALRKKGWHTIAQDQATSVVYGMPRAAAELGAAVEILPVDRISGALQRALGTRPLA
ncbi:MAG: chemotaxis-specific protein-glutamate methylesterase CheB [Acidobacteria bacterium]|nr:chemotaxis-specific protein-glutamate methylesterase CheB [Acidobacteriota bacterium]